jgi:hypothetical protein
MSIETRLREVAERLRALEAAKQPEPRRVVIANLGESVADCRARLELGPEVLVIEVEDSSVPR